MLEVPAMDPYQQAQHTYAYTPQEQPNWWRRMALLLASSTLLLAVIAAWLGWSLVQAEGYGDRQMDRAVRCEVSQQELCRKVRWCDSCDTDALCPRR